MSKKILIDSSINTETRIALIDNEKLEEYEVESLDNTSIKSNVYLAKISRVEASLQAAFVDFGSNRQGFLPLTEIHPDYFKIPVSDQKKLKGIISKNEKSLINENYSSKEDVDLEKNGDIVNETIKNNENNNNQKLNKKKIFFNFFKKYKIQEVIKPRQVLLVQISKEERGFKGAALTTYLSFAGRYCVLMPNSNSNIGISRKIQDQAERKKLKDILDSLGIPKGMSVIVRTAGIGKTNKEISKDLDFLISQWNKIRNLTLKSNAPSLIYEEGNIIKRTIRDLYAKDISSIIVDGKNGYNTAKQYIKVLIPSQLSKLKLYKEKKENFFAKYKLEKQIQDLYVSKIKLYSGGSIIINTTEALVAVDVNSGKATKHRNIETTALNTNLEAAVEIARQLKLRDLSGLIVIDFIDMEDHRNNFKVEKILKTATNTDRARIQIGRISPFGLLELSRQRLKRSIIEQSYEKCNICDGMGIVRNINSITEQLFKVLSQYCISNKKSTIKINCNTKLANEIINNKKKIIADLENENECRLNFNFDISFSLNEPEVLVNYKNDHDEKLSNTKNLHVDKSNIEFTKTKKRIKKKVVIKKKSLVKKEENNINDEKNDKDSKFVPTNKPEEEKKKKGWWS